MTRRPAPLRLNVTHLDATISEAVRKSNADERASREVRYRRARGIPDPAPEVAAPPPPAPRVPRVVRPAVAPKPTHKTPPVPSAVAPAVPHARGGRTPSDGSVTLTRDEWKRVERLIDHTVKRVENQDATPKPNPRNGWRR